MERDKFEKFTTDQLKKRSKAGFYLYSLLLLCGIIGVSTAILEYVTDKNLNSYLTVSALLCFLLAVIIYLGIKSTRGEIERRGNS
jgi:hypothetical protein